MRQDGNATRQAVCLGANLTRCIRSAPNLVGVQGSCRCSMTAPSPGPGLSNQRRKLTSARAGRSIRSSASWRRAVLTLSATSGHPSCQKSASPTTGFKVQLPSTSGCENRPILQCGRPRSCVTDRHSIQAVRPQFDQPNWNGRPASDMPVSTVNHALPDPVQCLYRAGLFDIHGTLSCRSPSSAPA